MSSLFKWLIIHFWHGTGRGLHKLAYDPDVQFRFHLVWAIIWIICMITSFWWPVFAGHLSAWFIFEVSLYANADTDYDAMSASLAAKYAKKADEELAT